MEATVNHSSDSTQAKLANHTIFSLLCSKGCAILLVLCLIWLMLGAILVQAARYPLPVNQQLGGPFNLQSTQEGVSGVQDLAGKVVLLTFGFTDCPDICPMTLARLTQLRKNLAEKAAATQIAFISVDDKKDTVERLTEYLQFFDADAVGFTGSAEQLKEVARQYGSVFMDQTPADSEISVFAHSDFVYLIDPQGRIRSLFAVRDPLEDLQADVEWLLQEAKGHHQGQSGAKKWWQFW